MTAAPRPSPGAAPGSDPGARWGARFGVLVGCTAWVFALAVVCLADGRVDLLLPVVVPLLLGSLGTGLLVLAPIELLYGRDAAAAARVRLPLTFGAVAIACGLLLLLAEGLLAPELRADPALGRSVAATGGMLGVPRWLPCLLLAGGCATLWVALRRAAGQTVSAP